MGLTIGGVAYDSWLARGTADHGDDLTAHADTFAFRLNARNSAETLCTAPSAGQEVTYTLPDTTLVFGGVLATVKKVRVGFRAIGYDCTCTDYRTWADRRTLNDRFVNQTAGQIVVALFARYAPEFDTSLVDLTGPAIASVTFTRPTRITGALDQLKTITGYYWDITPAKKVVWSAPGATLAPYSLTDTSRNFEDLEVEVDRSQLRNRVIVKGAWFPATDATTDYFTGDGLTANFRLTKRPYGLDQYLVFEEQFGSLKTSIWTKADVNNPSPAAGHTGADGYLYTTIQAGAALVESGKLQIVGGDSTWGHVRLQAVTPMARGDGYRRFEMDVYVDDATKQGRFGLWDPNSLTGLAGEQHGVYFNAGTLVPSEGGTSKTALATVTYTTGHAVRIRIVPGASSGATTWVNTDDANGFRASQWVKLYTSAVGSLANLTVTPAFSYNFIGRVGRVKVFNRIYGVTVTKATVPVTVGVLNVDNDGGVDALIGAVSGEAPVLSWFADTIPGAAVAVAATYYESIPVQIAVDDPVSIAAVKALENPTSTATGSDGIYEGYIEDTALDSLPLARAAGQQDVDANSNPLVTLTWRTRDAGLAVGQLITVTLTAALSGHTISGSYLIQEVRLVSLGSGNYEWSITAGSRLKGVGEYLIELLAAGKRLDTTSGTDSTLEQLVAGVDTLAFAESYTIVAGPAGPYLYADVLEDETGGYLLDETGGWLYAELSGDPPALYGLSCYT